MLLPVTTTSSSAAAFWDALPDSCAIAHVEVIEASASAPIVIRFRMRAPQ
jgi:hypothetical protein